MLKIVFIIVFVVFYIMLIDRQSRMKTRNEFLMFQTNSSEWVFNFSANRKMTRTLLSYNWVHAQMSIFFFFLEATIWNTILFSCVTIHWTRHRFYAKTLKTCWQFNISKTMCVFLSFLFSFTFVFSSVFWGIL